MTRNSLSTVGPCRSSDRKGLSALGSTGQVWPGIGVSKTLPLTALLLGDVYAESLGVNVPQLRRLVLGVAILLAAPVTAFCGAVPSWV